MATSTSSPTRGQFNTRSPTIRRILREASELATSPSPDFHAAPLETNLFEWHFTLRGPPSTPYSSGLYHGRIILPPTYPLRPPSFRFMTPSGRFETNREICLSISGHHEETWQPAWGLRTALVALRAFMGGEARGQVGGMEATVCLRKKLAGESRAWVCHGCGGRRNDEWVVGDEAVREGDAEKVPEDLRLAYRDEMTSSAAASTTPAPPEDPTPTTSPTPTPPPPPTATTTITAAAVTASPPSPWLDSAIYAIALLLALMIARRVYLLEIDDY